MATQRQIRANQLNAQKSTGPKTEEGKAASCQNALKHGLAGDGPVCQNFLAARVAQRKEDFRETYPTRTSADESLYDELCTASVLLEIARAEQNSLLVESVARAHDFWDADRMAGAMELAKDIQKHPELTVARLMQSHHGCLWIMDKWEFLLREWTEGRWGRGQETLAHELLGTPKGCREGKPWGPVPRLFLESRIAFYSGMAEKYQEIEDFNREAALQGLMLDVPRKLALMRRYEQHLLRRFNAARTALQKSDREAATPYSVPAARPQQTAGPCLSKPPLSPSFPEPAPVDLDLDLVDVFASVAPVKAKSEDERLRDLERAARRKREKQARKRQRRS
ncbi:MAG: hypothetical protein U0794_01170 [Isosphaeraceae bacterium]